MARCERGGVVYKRHTYKADQFGKNSRCIHCRKSETVKSKHERALRHAAGQGA